ncbi:hypothetical protein EXIGLDRAFT_717047 [Exidia glandulosa HHB12029]|uniref:Uncharacterized protein n=1 Tax=Exidia glandulosa HHB12029 TaxID=1314781 RepID=A0A165ILQ2_EXIGL|nr:hypothetical protein EXIGLDRAFT_717047 [Exidia glandulosa HHB12029]
MSATSPDDGTFSQSRSSVMVNTGTAGHGVSSGVNPAAGANPVTVSQLFPVSIHAVQVDTVTQLPTDLDKFWGRETV